MSTKINSRSPFYITATEPTAVEGAFSCSTAGLSNFSVDSDGTIINPTILKGTIIGQDQTEFAALGASDSSVSRTVNYTIQIPDGYSNTSNGTISCPQTFTQLPPTTCVAASNNNMAVFAGTISNLTNVSTGSTVSLGSFFSNGSSATITSYEVINYSGVAISSALTGTVPNQTLTFSTTSTCVSGTFVVRARNSVDACITTSNTFTVSSACTKALTCTTQDASNDAVALTGGNITSSGVVSIPSYNPVPDLNRINIYEIAGVSNTTDITSDVKAGNAVSALNNTTGSSRTVELTFRFTIPSSYSNAADVNLECRKQFTQPAAVTPALSCTDDFISYPLFRIDTDGTIHVGNVDVNGVLATGVSATTNISDGAGGFLQKFPEVTSSTARTIKVTFIIPTGFTNAGSKISTPCDVTGLTQPPTTNPCSATNPEFFLSGSSFSTKTGFCDNNSVYSVNNSVTINSSGTTINDIASGDIICEGNTTINGGNNYFAIAVNPTSSGAGNIDATFFVVRISEFGVIEDGPLPVNCGTDSGFDNIL